MNKNTNEMLSHIKARLETLNCPYLEDGSDQWLAQLLLHPCEARMRLLTWTITLFDEGLTDILQSTIPTGSAQVDTRYKKLLIAFNIMNVCKIDDLEIVRGTASQRKQLVFWDNLLDILYISQNGYLYSVDDSSFILKPAREPTLNESLKTSCLFFDSLVREFKTDELFSTELHLFSPDLENEIKRNSQNQELPTLDFLLETSIKMQNDIDELITNIQSLDDQITFTPMENTQVENYCRKFDVSMKMLSQMIDSYSYVHTNEIKTWCKAKELNESGVGPHIQTVSNVFHSLLKLTNDLLCFNKTSYSLNELKRDISKVEGLLHKTEDVKKLREISNVLQDALTRN